MKNEQDAYEGDSSAEESADAVQLETDSEETREISVSMVQTPDGGYLYTGSFADYIGLNKIAVYQNKIYYLVDEDYNQAARGCLYGGTYSIYHMLNGAIDGGAGYLAVFLAVAAGMNGSAESYLNTCFQETTENE